MMKRTKGLELIFIINLNTFGSKVFLILKIMDFENLPSTKVVHVYAIEGIYMIYNKFVAKIHLHFKCIVKKDT
jgi:hypothetical protein